MSEIYNNGFSFSTYRIKYLLLADHQKSHVSIMYVFGVDWVRHLALKI